MSSKRQREVRTLWPHAKVSSKRQREVRTHAVIHSASWLCALCFQRCTCCIWSNHQSETLTLVNLQKRSWTLAQQHKIRVPQNRSPNCVLDAVTKLKAPKKAAINHLLHCEPHANCFRCRLANTEGGFTASDILLLFVRAQSWRRTKQVPPPTVGQMVLLHSVLRPVEAVLSLCRAFSLLSL